MKENDKIYLDIKRIGINGEGIGYYNRLAIFVPNAIPGDRVCVTITKLENKMAYAKIESFEKKSDSRETPLCKYYEDCGACNTMHIKYDEMLKIKRDLVIEALSRYTKINYRAFEIRQTMPSKSFGYRNKSQMIVANNNDKFQTFMIKENSNISIPVDNCLVNDEVINELNTKILEIASKLKITSYDYKTKTGTLKYLTIRVNEKKEALVCFVCYQKDDKIKALAKEVIKLDNVKSVYENLNYENKRNVIYGEKSIFLEGDEYLLYTVNNIKYSLTPTTFFQLNSYQVGNLFEAILKNLKLSGKETVLDAYCGVGAIGLYVAKRAKEVIGIEYNKDSVVQANLNAKLNKIKNASFIQGDINKLLPEVLKDKQFDSIVVDPPRTGLGNDFINTILKTKINRIVYVSCNPATLAKDLEILKYTYDIKSISVLDMFPNTVHVESITTLVRKDK